MRVETIVDLDATFSALGDQTRRAILERLTDGEIGLADLAEPFPMSQTAVSKHVRVLSAASLVHVEKRSRTRYCRLNAMTLKPASVWIGEYESFWNEQVVRLARHLSEKQES